MSLERIAEILCVDEVKLMHGPAGVAVYVRTDKSWHSSTIDNDDLAKGRDHGDRRSSKERRLETIAEHLAHLADAHVHKIRDVMRKGIAASEGATRAALDADRQADLRRGCGWGNDWFDKPYDGPLRQVQRAEPAPAAYAQPPEVPAEPAVAAPMESRFHAIMAELRCL